MEAKLWRVALHNESVPEHVMAKALARVKVDIIQNKSLNHARMGILKAYHRRKGDENMQAYLNEEHPDPAYHCGRLMAVLAEIQQAALGRVNASVVQRYYAAASTTPALVLGRLVRTSNYHLDKIKDKKKRDGLKDFAVGFYQQLGKLASIDWAKYENHFTLTNTNEGDKA